MMKRWLFIVLMFAMTPFVYADAPGSCQGTYANVNDYKIYFQVHGYGVPVIFDSGLGDTLSVWDKVVQGVDQFAEALTYDRLGVGCSQKNAKQITITSQISVDNLHALLVKENIRPPYILVGHSLGGLNMQLFAAEYPREVKAVILVESMSREQTIFDTPDKNSNAYFEAEGIQKSIIELKQAPPFPPVRLIVLTATVHPGYENLEPVWQKWQKDLLLLSPESTQIIVKNSGHSIQKSDPNVVIHSINQLIVKADNS